MLSLRAERMLIDASSAAQRHSRFAGEQIFRGATPHTQLLRAVSYAGTCAPPAPRLRVPENRCKGVTRRGPSISALMALFSGFSSGALHVPQRQRLVAAARCQRAAVGAPGARVHSCRAGGFQCCNAVSRGNIPQLERPVNAARRNCAPIRAPSARHNRISVSAQSGCAAEWRSSRPKLQRIVVAGSHERAAIWAPGTTCSCFSSASTSMTRPRASSSGAKRTRPCCPSPRRSRSSPPRSGLPCKMRRLKLQPGGSIVLSDMSPLSTSKESGSVQSKRKMLRLPAAQVAPFLSVVQAACP